MANINPYIKTEQVHTNISEWEVKTFAADDTSITAELRGKSFYVSPAFGKTGFEQNHHEIEIDVDGPESETMQIHMGHAPVESMIDRVFSTYYYTIDFKNVGSGIYSKKYQAQYGSRRFNWWLVEIKPGFTVKSIKHKYFESKTNWLHGPVNQQVDFYGGRMRYSIALPPNYDPEENKKYPLVISVGGSGELGDDGRILTQTDPGCIICKNENFYLNYPAIHVTVQVPTSGFNEEPKLPYVNEYPFHSVWMTYYDGRRYGGVGIRLVIEKLLQEMPVDDKRIYMTGFSGGGKMSFEMLKYGRDIFAAIVPIAAWPIGRAYENVFISQWWDTSYGDSVNSIKERLKKEIHRARHIPTIVAAGSKDNMKYGTQAYHDVGKESFDINCTLKIYTNASHGGSPKNTWNDPSNVAWLFAQVRDNTIPEDRFADDDYEKPIEIRNYPMIKLTADNQGYYRVFVDGVHISNHVQEREAAERAANEKMKSPQSEVYFDHDYKVDVDYLPPEPTPEPDPYYYGT